MKTGKIALLCAAVWCCGVASSAQEEDPAIEGKPLSQLIKQLRSENRGFQLRAAQILAKAPAELQPAIVPKLLPLLKSERENDKFVAAQTLGEYGPGSRRAVPDLLPLLEGTQFERNRAAGAKALGQILKDAPAGEEIEKVAKALIAVFGDKYLDVRREAVQACGMIGPAAKVCVPHLPPLFVDQPPGSETEPVYMVRYAAAWTAGRMGAHSAVHIDRLIAMMHGELHIATPVIFAIGEIGPVQDNVVPNLATRLEKVLAGGGFYAAPCGFPVGSMTEGTVKEYIRYCFLALEKCGVKSAPAVPLMNRRLRDVSEGKLNEYDNDRLLNAIGACKVLRAVGPEAKEALPALEKAVGITRFDQRLPAKTVEDFKKEAQAALAAVKGEAPAKETEKTPTSAKDGKKE